MALDGIGGRVGAGNWGDIRYHYLNAAYAFRVPGIYRSVLTYWADWMGEE